MPNSLPRLRLLFFLMAALTWFLPHEAFCAGVSSVLGRSPDTTIIEDEDEPPGVAPGWIVGNRLLAEGKAAEALPYLHMAYRAHPEVILIAMDFQAALASEGYLRDAVNVMDVLVAAHPDSQSFLLRRSSLNLSAGHRDKALADLRVIRQLGNPTIDVLAAEASILSAGGQVSQALDVLRDGLYLYPDHGRDIYLEMARILRKADQEGSIPALMDEALERYPDEPLLWMVKIRSLAALSLSQEALTMAEEADLHFAELPADPGTDSFSDDAVPEQSSGQPELEGLPTDSFVVELADYYAQSNQIDKALVILQSISERGELGLTPSLWLARLLLGTGREEEGLELVEHILDQWPEAGRGWYLRGKVDEGQGDWDKAIPYYQRAVELAPYDGEIRLGVLRAMLIAWDQDLKSPVPDADQKAKLAEFEEHTMIASTLVPEVDSQGQMLLGYAFRTLKDMDRAAWRFKLAAENRELRVTALLQQSICEDEDGKVDEARSTLEILRREFPANPEVANSYGYFLAEKGLDLDLAEGLIREALEKDPGNGAYLDSLGWVMYRVGRFEEAFDFLIRAVNVLPDDPVILEHMGVVLMNMGQTSEALDILQRALSMGGDSQRINGLIADIEEKAEKQE